MIFKKGGYKALIVFLMLIVQIYSAQLHEQEVIELEKERGAPFHSSSQGNTQVPSISGDELFSTGKIQSLVLPNASAISINWDSMFVNNVFKNASITHWKLDSDSIQETSSFAVPTNLSEFKDCTLWSDATSITVGCDQFDPTGKTWGDHGIVNVNGTDWQIYFDNHLFINYDWSGNVQSVWAMNGSSICAPNGANQPRADLYPTNSGRYGDNMFLNFFVCSGGSLTRGNWNFTCPSSTNGCRLILFVDHVGQVFDFFHTTTNCVVTELKTLEGGNFQFHLRTSSTGGFVTHANGTNMVSCTSSSATPKWVLLDSNRTYLRSIDQLSLTCGSGSNHAKPQYGDVVMSTDRFYFTVSRDYGSCLSTSSSVETALFGSANSLRTSNNHGYVGIGARFFNGTMIGLTAWEHSTSGLSWTAYDQPSLAYENETLLYFPNFQGSFTIQFQITGGNPARGGFLSLTYPLKSFMTFDENGSWLNYNSDQGGIGRECPKHRSLGTGPGHLKFSRGVLTCLNSYIALDLDWDQTPDFIDALPTDNTQVKDFDGDGFGDNQYGNSPDACPAQSGISYQDRFGCSDVDADGWSDVIDAFPNLISQWNDTDSDGFGDNLSGFRGDSCPTIYGESRRNNTFGCVDSDFDGWADTQDHFPSVASQWNDSDGDGFGDEYSGFEGDACVNTAGNSTIDLYGCVDSDGDGYSDSGDSFDNNPTQWLDTDGDGYGNNQSTNSTQSDAFPNDGSQWNDTDGDGHGDNKYGTQGDHFPNNPNRWQDSDEDGYANEDDAFDYDATQWNDSDGDGYGDNPNGTSPDVFPTDNTEWSDFDGDGYGDNSDVFRFDGSQWADRDGDGYGDNPNGTNADAFPDDSTRWSDSDSDGIADEDDDFANDPTQSLDSDGDGYGDHANGTNPDAFPNDPTEWRDGDGDGYGDNTDAFPVDATQWNDTDNDGYGDNPYGSQGDRFPDDPTRWKDTDEDGVTDSEDAFPNEVTQNADRDGDGYGDNASGTNADRFPDDPNEWVDSDGDGVGDNADAFVFDPTQTNDTDGDGYGDNPAGSYADAFPNDPDRWGDTDKDGYANQDDAFPNDNTQWADRDGDGYGDNPNGTNADAFPDDTTQHVDRDGDGYGDNPLGTNADAFPSDTTQWSDRDGDGYGDNPTGQQPDRFPDNPTQYIDEDGDGLGDNPNGTEADPSLNDMDNDGYTDDVDILPNLASPGDMDNDGVPDEEDAFPADFREAKDSDGDGEGDNADVDDDNDGWTDIDEIREGADPFSSSVQPVEGFEVLIPSTQVSLGAWDIIGILTGVPLALWVGLGLMTRTQRGRKFEDMLNNAGSIEELNLIAADYESSLMWKMLGPHQGLRLERMRTEIERDKFAEQMKSIPEINTTTAPAEPEVSEGAPTLGTTTSEPSDDVAPPDASVKAQKTDENGYEWYSGPDGSNFYRPTGSGDAWKRYDG